MKGTPPDNWNFAITHDSMLVGGCSAHRGEGVQSHTAEIGYWLGVEHWGQGLATETISALLAHVERTSDIKLFIASHFGWNPASGRVLEKCGFHKSGIIHGAVRKWDKTTDLHLYSRQVG